MHSVPATPPIHRTTRASFGSQNDSQREYAGLIRRAAQEKGLSAAQAELLTRVAWCESRLQMKWNWRHQENPDYYTAYGLFQIIKTHQDRTGVDRMTVQGNIELALLLYMKNGTSDWNASKGCWDTIE